MFEQRYQTPPMTVGLPKESDGEVFVLDGYKNGITAYIKSEGSFITTGTKHRYFTNYEILESNLITSKYSKLDYQIKFVLNNGNIVLNIEDVYFDEDLGGYTCTIAGDYVCDIVIKPTYVSTVTSIGYLSDKSSDAKPNSKLTKEELSKFCNQKFNNIFSMVQNTANIMATYPKTGIFVSERTDKSLTIGLRGTTGKIIIESNSTIIDYNENHRKAKNIRCLPFDKSMDKYGTLYVYTTIDINEKEFIKDRLYHTLTELVDMINSYYPTNYMEYSRVSFGGSINIRKED